MAFSVWSSNVTSARMVNERQRAAATAGDAGRAAGAAGTAGTAGARAGKMPGAGASTGAVAGPAVLAAAGSAPLPGPWDSTTASSAARFITVMLMRRLIGL
jgi:hypothetical protein